ncbi:MAG: CRISPR-associated protein Csn1, partial [Paraprevotella sp.]|nr:CRISPR-associated protein Csn1 [Paraprevotella sp.]
FNIMSTILGIDTGSNSLGWAIVKRDEEGKCQLFEHGTHVFPEGMKMEGQDGSKAAERTKYRSSRKHYWRRKIRKIRLLTVLIENHLCPPISKQQLRDWRTRKLYPQDETFMNWQRTEDKENINPYRFRWICLTQKLDLTDPVQKQILERALYHLNQRRGFLSNRKEKSADPDGTVKQSISQLSKDIKQAGCQYLGEYFFQLYQKGEKIRKHYTARNEHYLTEFRAICEKQNLDPDLRNKLEKAIFFQRPLKSQKQQIGSCTFEPKKSRCSASHPLYEEFRMYSFINHIKMQTPKDETPRFLTEEEKKKIIPLFLRVRKGKTTFQFKDIAKELAGRNNYCHLEDPKDKPYKFNYYMDTTVSDCPVNAQLTQLFGPNWVEGASEIYTLAKGESNIEILNDIWHVLYSYDDETHLKDFAKTRLQLNEE